MANYKPAYPANVPVDAGVKDFITNFYTVSDTPGKNQEWVGFFEDDGALMMEKKEAAGKTEILKVREGMWEKVEARKHTVFKIFPASFGGDANGDEVELMLYGKVEYKLKTGEESGADWAGFARLVRAGGRWRFAYYRVYIQR